MKRRWVFSAECRSAVRLPEWDVAQIIASPESTSAICATRVRNSGVRFGDGMPVFGGLIVEASGDFESADLAYKVLGNMARGYLSIAAVAGNAAVDEPRRIVLNTPPIDSLPGEFIQQKNQAPLEIALKLHKIEASELVPLLGALIGSPREEIVYRAMAHFRMALGHLDRLNVMLAAESLFVACETLGRAIYSRLATESDGTEKSDTKHKLAVAAGFHPKSPDSLQHLYEFESHIRRHFIFEDDKVTYKSLKQLSHGVEHGYMGFGEAQTLAEKVSNPAFRLVRRAILRELEVPATSKLFDSKFDAPIGLWGPEVETVGTYTDSSMHSNPLWPQFEGMNATAEISEVIERSDGLRDVSLSLGADFGLMSQTQHAYLHRVTFAIPDRTYTLEDDELRKAITLHPKPKVEDQASLGLIRSTARKFWNLVDSQVRRHI